MVCLYHNDNDGKAAAFCVYAWVGLTNVTHDSRFIAMDYTTPVPFDTISPGEQVWIVDFSLKPADMDKLLAITKDVTWIDHHKTAIEAYANYHTQIRGVRRIGEAGCVLAWKYIHWYTERGDGPENLDVDRSQEPGMRVPKFIELIGDRDVWAFKNPDSRWFHEALALHDTTPGSDFWWDLYDLEVEPIGDGNKAARRNAEELWDRLQTAGETCLEYRARKVAELAPQFSWKADYLWDGKFCRCLCLNSLEKSSDSIGGDAVVKQYDFVAVYQHTQKGFSVSLYSLTMDVSGIAKSFGGGGHRGAAGFQCRELPFSPFGV